MIPSHKGGGGERVFIQSKKQYCVSAGTAPVFEIRGVGVGGVSRSVGGVGRRVGEGGGRVPRPTRHAQRGLFKAKAVKEGRAHGASAVLLRV